MWLTDLRGREVTDTEGRPLGTVRDVVISLHDGDHHPTISQLIVGTRRLSIPFRRDDLVRFDEESIEVRVESLIAPPLHPERTLELEADQLLLARDVLDTQIIDLNDHRVARVADVLLTRNSIGEWIIEALDVSFRRVLIRAHLSVFARSSDTELIDWAEIHLTSPRGHVVQLNASRSAVHRIPPADLAKVLERLDTLRATAVIESLGTEHVAEAIIAGHHETGERLLRAVSKKRAQHIIDAMPTPHDAHWLRRLRREPTLRGRRFHRLRGWRRHHPNRGEQDP